MSSISDFPSGAINVNNPSSFNLIFILAFSHSSYDMVHNPVPRPFWWSPACFPQGFFLKSYNWVHIVPYLTMYSGFPLRKIKFKLLTCRIIYHLFFSIYLLSSAKLISQSFSLLGHQFHLPTFIPLSRAPFISEIKQAKCPMPIT